MRKSGVIPAILLVAMAISPVVAAPQTVIVDNPNATFVGSWTTASSATDKYGSDYRYINHTSSGGSTATFAPSLPALATDWKVSVWYPTVSSASTAARFLVHHLNGDTTVSISQTSNVGKWVSLGTYTMDLGTDGYVQLSNTGSSTSRRVIADAVQFYSDSGGDTTPAVITDVHFTPGPGYAIIEWTTDDASTSLVEYGTSTSYGLQSNEDMHWVTDHSVVIGLAGGDEVIHFRVKSRNYGNLITTSGDYTCTALPQPPELRAFWCNTWNSGSILNKAEVSNLVDLTYNANYNMIIPEIRKCGDAYYTSHPVYSPIDNMWFQEHKATNINDPDPDFDPLQDCIDKAHAKGMQVNAWIVAYRIWSGTTAPSDHIVSVHGPNGSGANWVMMKSDGVGYLEGSNYNLDPGIPGVQDYIAKIVVDIVKHYDVDGFNYDYIRYPGLYWGYNPITRQRFHDEYGIWPPTSNTDINWPTWAGFLRQQVTDLVKKCYLEIMAIRPSVNHNVDTVGWTQGDPNADFTGTRQYLDVNQDAKSWMEQHIIDMNLLMNYKREYESVQGPDYDVWTHWLSSMQSSTNRWSMSGQACYLNSILDSTHQMLEARKHGVAICNYDFLTTNKDGEPKSTFLDTVRSHVFPTKVPVPDMPWKSNPTTGIIFGTVTNAAKPNDPVYWNWIYKATVTATGPVTRTTTTDATGTYGFIDLPPGTYSISIAKTGFPTRTYTNQTLAAGQVLREDVELGTVTCTSPEGAAAGPWSLVSLPLEPVNSDPSAVFGSISINNHLYKWDNPTQLYKTYDSGNPGSFGNASVTDAYWLSLPGAATISYEAWPGTPATRDIAIPNSGWATFGCPFLTEKRWSDLQVMKAGETVTLSTAANTKGWISSTGWWWDSSTQSLVDVGPSENFPSSENLQPWHGYWIETYSDGLTLTIR